MSDTLVQPKLAIVIPAYKPDFLVAALACLPRQTDQRFTLYIYDDASPADISGIARATLGRRPYTYHRFEQNLGGESLPRHWNRCLAQVTEPWVWLFSDDDRMDDHCVAAFYRFLETEGEAADILRFDAWIIDEQDDIAGLHTLHPDRETGLEFAYGHLMGWRRSLTPQQIFRRTTLAQAGGFLDLPLAWSTDDAAVIALGRHKPIRRLAGARVYWRCSSKNITPDRTLKLRRQKILAVCQFLQWLHQQLQLPREPVFKNDAAAFARAMDRFLVEQITIEGALPALANWGLLAKTRREVCQSRPLSLLKYIAVAAVADTLSAGGALAKKLLGR